MKTRIFWGIVMILLAGALIMSVFGIGVSLPFQISVWQIVLGLLCLSWVVRLCSSRRLMSLPLPLMALAMIFEREIALALKVESGDLAPWWVFVLVAILLSWGLRLLFPRKTHGWKGKIKSHIRGGGAAVHYFDCTEPFEKYIENNLGTCSVYFTNAELYVGGSTLRIENNLGALIINVPSDWCVSVSTENNLGSIKTDADLDRGGSKLLYIVGENNLGSVVIKKA
jgi:predicted membrane protein